MRKSVKIYWMRFILAFLILPAAIGLTIVLVALMRNFSTVYIPFLLGVVCYTLIYPVFKKPLLGYVVGHELTHVLGVWFSRGKIYGIRVSRKGGMVKTDRSNIWTALLPYFFPIYTILVLGIYFMLSILWDMSRFYNWIVFFVGFTWAFHFWMTIYVLRHNQPDIRYSGVIFSVVVIYIINLIILSLILVIISSELNIQELINESFLKIKGSYIWILKKLV